MYIEIHHNTSEALTEADRAVLQVLLGNKATPATPSASTSQVPGGTPKKTTVAKPAPKAEPEPEDDSTEAGNDSGSTLEDAVALAKQLVGNGEAAKVKKALTAVGAKKVSEIPEDKVDEFIAATESD